MRHCLPNWRLHTACFMWIFTLLLVQSYSKTTQTYFMQDHDCWDVKHVSGATVFSHNRTVQSLYPDGIACEVTFKAEKKGWRLMLRILELDIPDRNKRGICNDVLYIYDGIYSGQQGMSEAGGNGGLCGNILPPTLYSSGEYLTTHFRTNGKGPHGTGFVFTITAFSEEYEGTDSCGSNFQCDMNNYCIDNELVCDNINHCGDYSDERAQGRSECSKKNDSFWKRFLSLGVAALIAICVGSIVILVVCLISIVCCCKRRFCKQEDTTNITSTPSGAHMNGALPYLKNPAPQPVQYGCQPYVQHGYCQMPQVVPIHHGSVYSQFTRDNFTHSSSPYSSHPPSYHRSFTPSSSKSGRSNKSDNNSTSVTYSQGTDHVTFPVNL